MLYHFAFVALSLAMFGMTAGALVVYLAPNVFTADRLRSHLALAAVAFPIAIVLSFLTQLSIPFRVHPSIVAIYAIAFTYVVIAVPFVVSGIVVCLVLTGFPARVSRLYAADLAGAALGCVLLIPVLDYSDGPTAVLWVAVLAVVGALTFALERSSRALRRVGGRDDCRARGRGCRTHAARLARIPGLSHPLHQGIVRGASALREVEFVFARPRQRQPDQLGSAPGLGAESACCRIVARAAAADGHRCGRRHGASPASTATCRRSST